MLVVQLREDFGLPEEFSTSKPNKRFRLLADVELPTLQLSEYTRRAAHVDALRAALHLCPAW